MPSFSFWVQISKYFLTVFPCRNHHTPCMPLYNQIRLLHDTSRNQPLYACVYLPVQKPPYTVHALNQIRLLHDTRQEISYSYVTMCISSHAETTTPRSCMPFSYSCSYEGQKVCIGIAKPCQVGQVRLRLLHDTSPTLHACGYLCVQALTFVASESLCSVVQCVCSYRASYRP